MFNNLHHAGKVSEQLHDLADRLRQARADDDFIETDLNAWMITIRDLKRDFTPLDATFDVHEDRSRILVGRMGVHPPAEEQELRQLKRFGESLGDVSIEEYGRVIVHRGSSSENTFVRGTTEYSSGKHRVRLLLEKSDPRFSMGFFIISKSTNTRSESFDLERSCFGWYSSDATCPRDTGQPAVKNNFDMRGQRILQIELTLDCNNRTISYFNETTKNRRAMNVDITKCPFPWQLFFYLFDTGDSVRFV